VWGFVVLIYGFTVWDVDSRDGARFEVVLFLVGKILWWGWYFLRVYCVSVLNF